MGNDPHIVNLNPFTVEDVLQDILMVGVATGREANARAAVDALEGRIAVASKIGGEAAKRRGRPLKVPPPSPPPLNSSPDPRPPPFHHGLPPA